MAEASRRRQQLPQKPSVQPSLSKNKSRPKRKARTVSYSVELSTRAPMRKVRTSEPAPNRAPSRDVCRFCGVACTALAVHIKYSHERAYPRWLKAQPARMVRGRETVTNAHARIAMAPVRSPRTSREATRKTVVDSPVKSTSPFALASRISKEVAQKLATRSPNDRVSQRNVQSPRAAGAVSISAEKTSIAVTQVIPSAKNAMAVATSALTKKRPGPVKKVQLVAAKKERNKAKKPKKAKTDIYSRCRRLPGSAFSNQR